MKQVHSDLNPWMKQVHTHVVKEQVVKKQVVGATTTTDKSQNQKKRPQPSLEGLNPENRTPEIAFVKGAGQAADAAPTLRYGPAGDTAPFRYGSDG